MFEEGTPLQDINSYQRLFGKLLYITITRPDISYVIQFLSQFLQAPTIIHYNGEQHV